MTRDETLALWAASEAARKAARESQSEESAHTDAAHAAAKAVWDGHFASLLAEGEALKAAGTWKLGKGAFGNVEPPGRPSRPSQFNQS